MKNKIIKIENIYAVQNEDGAPQMLAALRAALEAMGDSYDATDAAGEEGAALWEQVADAIETATGETWDH